MDMIMQEGETILKEGSANSFGIALSRGGKLAVTNQRVLWQGHALNIGGQADVINLSDIVACGKCVTITIFALLLPIPNAIYISTKDGKTYKYTVYKRKEWLDVLNKAIKDRKNAK
ncbi:hypothetical protein LJC31_03400 [Synergistaceae bacterium OttesenSCG-928-I11]|nr:hypothetical protein [Synergistaceae bacterium OttesenSCG-928-I11]